MKYLKQFVIILAVTCAGEFLKMLLPFPVPASIYGLVIMLLVFVTGKVKLEQVDSASIFLIQTMPVMFIPAGVGLIQAWPTLKSVAAPVLFITIVTTFIVMTVTGKITDYLVQKHDSRGGAGHE